MIAAFDSQCEACFGDIEEGYTEITHHPEMGWIHLEPEDCDENHPDYEDEFTTF